MKAVAHFVSLRTLFLFLYFSQGAPQGVRERLLLGLGQLHGLVNGAVKVIFDLARHSYQLFEIGAGEEAELLLLLL